jgi:ABC-type glycerol-3-phosphate transport system substrate-binding protein
MATGTHDEKERSTMSDETKTPNKPITSRVSRRTILKSGAVAGAGVAAGAISPKASKVFAAPAVLQNEPIELDYVTWFWNEPGRGGAWREMIEDFHASQNEIRIREAGWPFPDFANNIIVQLQAGRLEGDVIQTTPDLVLRLLRAGTPPPSQ